MLVPPSRFEHNTAGQYGGAVYGATDTILQVDKAEFLSNAAKYGGGVFSDDVTTTNVVNSVFDRNTASIRGPALYQLDKLTYCCAALCAWSVIGSQLFIDCRCSCQAAILMLRSATSGCASMPCCSCVHGTSLVFHVYSVWILRLYSAHCLEIFTQFMYVKHPASVCVLHTAAVLHAVSVYYTSMCHTISVWVTCCLSFYILLLYLSYCLSFCILSYTEKQSRCSHHNFYLLAHDMLAAIGKEEGVLDGMQGGHHGCSVHLNMPFLYSAFETRLWLPPSG